MDCTPAGTALDRVVHSALSSNLQGNSDASRHAIQAFGSLVGTAATADATFGGGIMPSGPLETYLPPTTMMPMEGMANSTHRSMMIHPSNSDMYRIPSVHQVGHTMPPRHAMHNHVMMQQMQQYQMMQMQQMHLSAMVEHQRAMQRTQQAQSQQISQVQSHKSANHETETVSIESDDVVTVNDEELDELHNEGRVDHASIERLAQAWRDAEAEFAAEFDDEYDVSDMGGLYESRRGETETAAINSHSTDDPTYEFSPLSQKYGCITTSITDIAPQLNYPDNLYERGLQHFHSGEISEAILCFESTLRNIDPEHADAWRMLGKCHTESDADSKAITCYLKSLERDPYSPETLLALVVAYVNELDWDKAVKTLKLWVGNHPLYAGMETGGDDLYGSAELEGVVEGGIRRMNPSTMVEMRDVERLLLRALDYNRDNDAAADVYEALGVVYNVSREYDAAVDSFQRAIQVRPEDYQLRNKLGATLANSNRSEEALPEYHAALKLKPKYTRGWLNMAISHSNLRNYSQAARCYLQTLSLNPDATHVWSYLRIALTCDEKWDLLPLAASQNLSAFHEHFDFVEY